MYTHLCKRYFVYLLACQMFWSIINMLLIMTVSPHPKAVHWEVGLRKIFPFLYFCTIFFFNDEDALFYFVKALVILQLRFIAAAAAKSLQSCPTLCDPTDGSPPGSPVPGILQAGTLEWLPGLLHCFIALALNFLFTHFSIFD